MPKTQSRGTGTECPAPLSGNHGDMPDQATAYAPAASGS